MNAQHPRSEQPAEASVEPLALAARVDPLIFARRVVGVFLTAGPDHPYPGASLLLRALGVAGRIKSPTYAVVEPHQPPHGLPVWHFDFYRFDDPREWEDAGFRDLFAAPGLKLAEWPDKAAAVLPPADLQLDIEVQEDGRRSATLAAGTPLGRRLLKELQA